ncbi:catalase family protein [Cereibacter sphaeroides]|uniref:catalase family protein n=1 Tax=Cereibacter sphaeroides TaxID=1063 RepID=UPI0039906528
MRDPIRYAPDIERPEAEEEQTERLLCRALTEILDTTSGNYGHAVRAVHAKSHGIFEARFEILPDLPPELAQGLFARPGRHPALVRISTNPGDLLPDSVSVPRGLALKILEVEGPRLAHAEGDTQDFVMVNGPAFVAPDAASFLKSLNRLARTTDQATWAKIALSSVLRGAEKVLEAAGGESATLKTMGGAPNVHPLGESYFSQTAFRHGDFIAKYQLVPVSDSLTRLTGEEIPASGAPDALRERVAQDLAEGGVWEFRVQLCRNAETMPVEDPSRIWSEEESPFVTVARLTAPPQPGWSEARAEAVDDPIRFSVWTGLAAHRPLGAINRVRQATYRLSSDYRAAFNRCPIHEPDRVDLP